MSKTNQPMLHFDEAAPTLREGFYFGDKPNPHLQQFIIECLTPYTDGDDYSVRAFSEPITVKRSTSLYHMHTYWSKKPHEAIAQYINHYTSVGDTVLDPMCGSGGTALAALMNGRKAIVIDRSPAATFISANYCTPHSRAELDRAIAKVSAAVSEELRWLYATVCDRCNGPATTIYTLLSQTYQCPRCLRIVAIHDCVTATGQTGTGKAKAITVCPHCHESGIAEEISTRQPKHGILPVMVSYMCDGRCNPKKSTRSHIDPDKRKREAFEKFDIAKLKEIDARDIPYWYPTSRMMNNQGDGGRWGLMWRPYHQGIQRVCDFYSKRNLWAMACIYNAVSQLSECRNACLFNFTSIAMKTSLMMAHNSDGIGRIQKGTLYIPSLIHDVNVERFFGESFEDMKRGYDEMALETGDLCVSTDDACHLKLPSDSIDYVFTDPPYSWKVQFGELNFIWEAWLQFDSEWHEHEIIVNEFRGFDEEEWSSKMRQVFSECYRVLKPGRWMSLCYHDTSEGTWAHVQDICAEVGFIVDQADEAIYIDGTQKSIKQITAEQVSRRDLVVNFRKPKPGDWVVTHLLIPENADRPTFAELARQIISDFLTNNPGATKDRVYDHLVSRMVRRGEMEAHDFEEILGSVAEEVRGAERNEVNRWYLRGDSDHVLPAEQDKEDATAQRLEGKMAAYLKKHPEEEGVHFSQLFEWLITTKPEERPRRSFDSWLPEYFFKTPEGTWRPPADEAERQQKAAIREAGTLRRVKRFANALLEGVPVRDQDRPDSARTLAEWIRQCRRAGLYEQGRVMYEKGGLDLDRLDEDEQIEVEDDYRICVKRGSEEVVPKKSKGKGKC